eukprot:CAMPEP_0117426190 /NCGR_PEP_ID=MMETSP0758-20121206/6347_1 /TAXON_ID=63605 /ORGANISM="Percolomonas cosmopolitus, Strain AE-1 (ATCC 50343)" /LENGTH=72 /DNA_ID=CAMNT_0005211197 /DNA_START=342 /DNA_END=557 /DNA_ORIENTATION=+
MLIQLLILYIKRHEECITDHRHTLIALAEEESDEDELIDYPGSSDDDDQLEVDEELQLDTPSSQVDSSDVFH